jgi:hypothetical protein
MYIPYLLDKVVQFERALEQGIPLAKPSLLFKMASVLDALWPQVFEFSSWMETRGVEVLDGFW